MSAYNLIEFLPPALCEEDDVCTCQDWLEGRSWVPEIYSHTAENAPVVRKRRLRVTVWAEGGRAEVPIVERFCR